MRKSGSLDAMVEAIYDGAGTGDFGPVLGLFAARFPGTRNSMMFYDAAGGPPDEAIASDFDAAAAHAYVAHYQHHNPWLPAQQRLAPGRVVHSDALAPREDLHRSAFYAEWLTRQPEAPLEAAYGMVLFREEGRFATFASHFPDALDGDPDTRREMAAVMEHILPHLRRALELRRRLRLAERRASSLEATLDRLAAAVFVVRADGGVVFANEAAEALLRAGGAVVLRHGRLAAGVAGEDRAIRQAVGAACGARAVPAGPELLTASRRDGPPLAVFVAPLPSVAAAPVADRVAAVFVTDPALAPVAPPAWLQRLFGLTAAEADVAMRFVASGDLRAAAEESGRAYETARGQLKQVMAKMEVRRQAELARVVAAALSPLGTGARDPE